MVCSDSEDNLFQIGWFKIKMINNADNGKWYSYNDFRYIENKISRIVGTSFSPKQSNKIDLFAVIAMKHLDIVFEQTI